MSKAPEQMLEEFLASQPSWVQTALEGKYLFSSAEEQLKWIKQQDLEAELRLEYEQILRQIPGKWNEYCDTMKKGADKAEQLMRTYVSVPQKLAGASRKDLLAREAILLRERGMNFAQIAAELNKKYGCKKTTHAAIAKLVKRYIARTKSI